MYSPIRTFIILFSLYTGLAAQNDPDSLYLIADSLHKLEKYDEKLLVVKKIYNMYPNDYYAAENLGTAYLFADSLIQARRYLWDAIKSGQATDNAYYNLACIECRVGNMGLGLKYLEQSFIRGYIDYIHLDNDPDLDQARKMDKYQLLIQKVN